MRKILTAAVLSTIVAFAGCDSGDTPQKQKTTPTPKAQKAKTKETKTGSADKPELVETVDRAEPREVQGSSCKNPARLKKLAANTVLTADGGGCYLIEETLQVRGQDSKLTIKPGVTIKFAENTGLYVHKAALEAEGTPEEPVTLTGQRETPGFWRGVAIRGSNHTSNRLNHVQINYAGNQQTFDNVDPAALMFDASRGHNSFDVTNTTLQHSASFGLYAEHDLSGDFENNTVTANKKGAVHIHPRSATLLDGTSSFSGNDRDEIRVWGAKLTDGTHTWPGVDVPYHMTGTIEARHPSHFVLKPGVEMQFDENTGLYLHKAKITAEGTESAPIKLTGHREVKGFWRGVAMRGSDSIDNVLEHVTIEYAGSDNSFSNVNPAGLMLDASRGANSLSIQNCTLQKNASYGLYSEHDTEIDFANNSLTANEKGAARIHPSIVGMLDSASQYSGNDEDRVVVWGAKLNGVEATWSAIDVPYYIESVIEISNDSFITLEPGATLEFGENAGLYVHKSRLKAAGTAQKPIVLTGERESAGFWRGVAMRGTTSIDNQFKHVRIAFAGSSNNFSNVSPAALMLDQSRGPVKVTIDQLEVTKSGTAALHIENDAAIESSDCASVAGEASPRFTDGSRNFEKACTQTEG